MNIDIGVIWDKSHVDVRSVINAMFFGTRQRIKFYKKMASFTKKGRAMVDVFSMLIKSAKENKRNFVYVLERTEQSLREGKTFHASFSPFIPDSDKSILVTAEKTGNISEVFEKLANSLEQIKNMTQKAYGNGIAIIIYISFVLVILSGITAQISELMSDIIAFSLGYNSTKVEFSTMANLYVSMGNYIINYGLITAFFLVVILAIIVGSLPRWSGDKRDKVHRYFLPWTVYRSFIVAKFFLALASLLRSGLVLKDALKILRENSNPYLCFYIDKMINIYSKTSDPRKTFQSRLYKNDTNYELSFYMGNSENIDTAIDEMAQEQLINANTSIVRSTKVVNFVVFLFVILIIAWSGLSIYEIMENMSKSSRT